MMCETTLKLTLLILVKDALAEHNMIMAKFF